MITIYQRGVDGQADVLKTDANHTRFDLYDYTYYGTHLGEHKVVATIHSPVRIIFNVGEKVLFRGQYYFLQTKPIAQRVYNSQMIQYTLTFYGVEYELSIMSFQDMVLTDESAYNTSGTIEVFDNGTVDDLMKRIIANTLRVFPNLPSGWEWSYTINPSVELVYKDISVVNGYCSDALALVNTLFGLDYFIDEKRHIAIGYDPIVVNVDDTPVTFEFGLDKGICEINRLQNEGKIVTRAIGFGSSRNIPQNYRADKYSTRLMLPFDTCPNGYVDAPTDVLNTYGIREGIYPSNDNIYPSITGIDLGDGRVDQVVSVNPYTVPDNGTVTVTVPAYREVLGTLEPRYVGQRLEGGIVFYIEPASNGLKGLIVSDTDTALSKYYESLSGGAPYATGANGILIGDGQANSNILLAHPRALDHAVKYCNDLVVGAYSDWYLPSSGELKELYNQHAKIGAQSSFNGKTYWSSTEVTGADDWQKAKCVSFADGNIYDRVKNNSYAVRAIRSFDNSTAQYVDHPAETKEVAVKPPTTLSFQVRNPGFSVFQDGILSPNPPKISFTSGNMQGVEFKILGFDKVLTNGEWTSGLYKVTIERDATDPAHIIPNEFANIVADDTFVYLDIYLPDIYVHEAEDRLKTDVDAWLVKQLKSPQGYSIKLTEEWIAVNQDAEPLIRESNALHIKDTELSDTDVLEEQESDILIQTLSITYKMEDQLPTYDVTVSPTPLTSVITKLKADVLATQQQGSINNYLTNTEIQNAIQNAYNLERRITTTNGDVNGGVIAPQTITLKSASLTTRDTNYVLQAYFQVNYLGDANSALGSAGVLIHKDGDLIWGDVAFDLTHQTWTIDAPQTFTLETTKAYWVYIKGSLIDGTAEWVVSETRLGVYEYANYFLFEWGQINPTVDNFRYVQSQYGQNGISSYVYIAYASDDQGTDFTLTPDPLLDYMAILSTTSLLTPPVVTDFAGLWYNRAGEGGIVTSGAGMDFTGSEVILGLPSTVDSTTINEVTSKSHTHKLGSISIDSVKSGIPVEYGNLYNWEAYTNSKKITSSDSWIVPTKDDVDILVNFIGDPIEGQPGDYINGGNLKESGETHWVAPNEGATNSSKFNALPGGYRWITGSYGDIGYYASFSTTSINEYDHIFRFDLFYNADMIEAIYGNEKLQGSSIRLLKTSTSLTDGQEGVYTGNDGKIYPTICIGTQEWLAVNLSETKFRDGDSIPFEGVNNGYFTNTEWAELTGAGRCAYNNADPNIEGEIPLASFLHNPVTIATASAAFGLIDANQELTLTEPTWDALPDKPDILAIGDWVEDITFEYRDIEAGTSQTYVLDPKALYAYTINSASLEVDNGTLTGVAIKIGSTAVTSLSSITVDTAIDTTVATGANSVAIGDRVTLVTSTGYTGTPQTLIGNISKTRV